MRYARKQIVSIRWVPAMLPLLAALVTGCRGQVEGVGPGAGNNTGTGGTSGAAGSMQGPTRLVPGRPTLGPWWRSSASCC